jgi:uncharacterized protein (TIGR02118 family)
MQRVTVAYPNKTGAKFDFDYYMKKHIPFVAGLVGKSIEVGRGISSASGSPAAFVCVAAIPIDSVAAFQAILAQHGAEIFADIPNLPISSRSFSSTKSWGILPAVRIIDHAYV